MVFLHLFDAAESLPGGAARLLRREPGGQRVALGQLEMGEDFGVELAIEPALPTNRGETGDEGAELHDLASRKRVTSAVAFSQFSTST